MPPKVSSRSSHEDTPATRSMDSYLDRERCERIPTTPRARAERARLDRNRGNRGCTAGPRARPVRSRRDAPVGPDGLRVDPAVGPDGTATVLRSRPIVRTKPRLPGRAHLAGAPPRRPRLMGSGSRGCHAPRSARTGWPRDAGSRVRDRSRRLVSTLPGRGIIGMVRTWVPEPRPLCGRAGQTINERSGTATGDTRTPGTDEWSA